jgi:hypothetical protein
MYNKMKTSLNMLNANAYQWRIFRFKKAEIQGQFFGTDVVACKKGH